MTDLLIDRLAGVLAPVRHRRVRDELALLGVLGLAEAALLFALGMTRGDFGLGLHAAPIELWKIAAPAILAVAAIPLALRGGDPARAHVGLWPVALVGCAVLVAGIALSLAAGQPAQVPQVTGAVARGLACVFTATLLACPPALALAFILRRAAPARPGRTALAAGLAAGAFGAALLGLHCPDDGALHSLVWHPLGVLAPALLAALPIARMARW